MSTLDHKKLKMWASVQSGICMLLLLASFSLEHLFHLMPCVLCQLQRVVVFGMILCALIQCFNLNRRVCFLISSGCLGCLIMMGLALAGRHIWLQHQPLGQTPIQCLPALSVMWQWLPWHTVLMKLVQGDGMCRVIIFRFLGLSLPMWLSVVYLSLLGLWGWIVFQAQQFYLNVKGA